MPNYCDFNMHVRGRKEDIDEFIGVMLDYDLPRHFWRVFEAEQTLCHTDENNMTVVYIDGYCAWSVYTCMCTGVHTYANDVAEERRTSLQKESERLNLDIEVYSDEPGVGFQEHYLYKNGKEIIFDCVDCAHICFEEIPGESDEERAKRFDEFKSECPIEIEVPLDEFDCDNGYYEIVVGGYDPWKFSF